VFHKSWSRENNSQELKKQRARARSLSLSLTHTLTHSLTHSHIHTHTHAFINFWLLKKCTELITLLKVTIVLRLFKIMVYKKRCFWSWYEGVVTADQFELIFIWIINIKFPFMLIQKGYFKFIQTHRHNVRLGVHTQGVPWAKRELGTILSFYLKKTYNIMMVQNVPVLTKVKRIWKD
jgi:hypothetical protein